MVYNATSAPLLQIVLLLTLVYIRLTWGIKLRDKAVGTHSVWSDNLDNQKVFLSIWPLSLKEHSIVILDVLG